MKEQTIGDIIRGARQSIDDADPFEWSAAITKNYSQQTQNFDLDKASDEINKPQHYNYGKYETIDVIVDTLGQYEAINYCHGNVLKYIIRMWHKGTPEKDLQKAIWYSNKMLELLKETKGVNW
jgi:hypothetical protein